MASFYKWLTSKAIMSENTPVGDLSKDAYRDNGFKACKDDIYRMHGYLFCKSACAGAHQALDEAWSRFKGIDNQHWCLDDDDEAAEVEINITPRSPISLAMRFKILKRDNYKCRLCGRDASDGVKLEIDHMKAVANGGDNRESNLWTLCFDCNRGKRTSNV